MMEPPDMSAFATWGDWAMPAWCPDCGQPHQLVRPGKTQPACDCDEMCPGCGDPHGIVYHGPGVRLGVQGYYCLTCWDRCAEAQP